MRLLVLTLLPILAWAQPAPSDPVEPTPPGSAPEPAPPEPETPEAAAPSAGPTEEPARPKPAAERPARAEPSGAPAAEARAPSEEEIAEVTTEAQRFFSRLLAADGRALVAQSAFPFHLEARRVDGPEDLLQEWLRHLRTKRTDLLTVRGLEVLTPAQMERKYGRPPPRLASFPWRFSRTYLAVADLSGRAAIAVFRAAGAQWKVIGYHD